MSPKFKDFDLDRRDLESNEEQAAVVWAENNGWVVRKMKYLGRRDCPDRFFFGYGQIIPVEFKKRKGGKLSSGQCEEHKRLAAVGVPVLNFNTSDSAIAFLKSRM